MTKIKEEFFFGIIFLMAFFLPPLGVFFYFNPILIIFFSIKYFRLKIGYISIALIYLILISFTFADHTLFNLKNIQHSVNILLLFFFFPFVKNIRLKNVYLFIGILYVLLSQLSIIFNFPLLVNFFNEYYVRPEFIERILNRNELINNAGIQSINTGLRSGGLFVNSNICAQMICFLYTIFLIENSKNKYFNIPKTTFTILALISLLISGSRTGFFIFIFSFIVDYYFYFKDKINFNIAKLLILFMFLGFVYYIYFISDISDSYRMFALNEGFNDSLSYKTDRFITYLNNSDLFTILFGRFYKNVNLLLDIANTTTMDSEWGWGIYFYGLFFMILYVLFHIRSYKYLSNHSRLFLINLLWGVSSTVLFSYKVSLIYFIFLSKYSYDLLDNKRYISTDSHLIDKEA